MPPVEAVRLIRPGRPVRLAFTGDINLGTITLEDGLPPDSGRLLFGSVDSLLVGNLVVGNFEGVLADSGFPTKCGPQPADSGTGNGDQGTGKRKQGVGIAEKLRSNCYAFGTPTYLAPSLVEAGFTHLNLANNHANDFGSAGRLHTEWVFDSLGLQPYGPLGKIIIDTLRQGDSITVVGLIGFATYSFAYDLLDLERSAVVVDSISRLADVVVVTFHGGSEGTKAIRTAAGPDSAYGEPRGDVRRWARAVIDAGADAVVGHGPHVLRGVEFYAGKPIFYSLGNFATYRGFNITGPQGTTVVLQLELGGDGTFITGRLVPLLQRSLAGPEPDPTQAALRLMRRVTKLDFPDSGARIGPGGEVLPPE